jgi:hypothetical protein
MGACARRAGVAQSVEHLICNQGVGGSNPFASSSIEDHIEEDQVVEEDQEAEFRRAAELLR